jgi:hypothetical protein
MPLRARRMALTALTVLCAGVLTGCGSDPRLKALQGDPMATATLPHTTLQREYTERTHTALGMPVHAQVLRVFTFSGVDPKVLVDEGAALARKNGWKEEFRSSTGYIGSKEIGDGAHLTITVGGLSGTTAFTVVLTADQANR